jgi:hypothetical protein
MIRRPDPEPDPGQGKSFRIHDADACHYGTSNTSKDSRRRFFNTRYRTGTGNEAGFAYLVTCETEYLQVPNGRNHPGPNQSQLSGTYGTN